MDDVLKNEGKPLSPPTGFDVPFDVVELPSKGKLYKGTSLEDKETIEVHYLTAKEEDILTSPNLIQSGKILDVLVKSVLKDRTIVAEDLLLGDRNTILVWLRSTGYGENYPIEISCQTCGHGFVNEFDLSSLDMNYLSVDPDEDGTFTTTLPVRKNEVKFKLLTARDEAKILRKVEDMKKLSKSPVNSTATVRMKQSIVEVDGNSDPMNISRFVETMPVKDSKAFRSEVEKIEPGIDMHQEVACPSCGARHREVIPIRANFFWPDD